MTDTCSHYVNLGCPGFATLAAQCAAKPCAGHDRCPRHQHAWDRPRARRYRTISTKVWRALEYQRRTDLTKFVTDNPIASADQRWSRSSTNRAGAIEENGTAKTDEQQLNIKRLVELMKDVDR